ncbi:MAG: ATP-binding protein [Clostridia bacterium]|nr:ATP-binding protein [Clostridia bacterium]
MEKYLEIEKGIITTYRKRIYRKFRKAIEDYHMIKDGDKIAVCISGGKDSMLMAKCFQEFQKHGNLKFDLVFLVMNPGYDKENLELIKSNSKLLNIPIEIFDSDIFKIIENSIDDSPCFLCAKMRRGVLYGQAEKLGCNKIALGHHFDDAIETLLLNIFYGGEVKTMMPKLHSDHFNLELIRPMFYVKEDDIISWRDSNHLTFLDCACKFSKEKAEEDSKRLEIKKIIQDLRHKSKYADTSIFHSMSNVNLNAMIGWTKDKQNYSFLDEYDLKK